MHQHLESGVSLLFSISVGVVIIFLFNLEKPDLDSQFRNESESQLEMH